MSYRYEHKKLIGLCALDIINTLVELRLTIKQDKKKNQKLYITGKSSNVIKTRVKT